jgi:DNA-binding HxlR family transcriptional regulator
MRPADRPSPPTAELFDLLGRRWALRILWELREEPVGFAELQVRCDGMSTSVLSQRLGELRDAGLVEQRGRAGYALSDPGSRLLARLKFFDDWASQWAEQWGRAARVRGERTDQGGKR